jgi:hypothetical protein
MGVHLAQAFCEGRGSQADDLDLGVFFDQLGGAGALDMAVVY